MDRVYCASRPGAAGVKPGAAGRSGGGRGGARCRGGVYEPGLGRSGVEHGDFADGPGPTALDGLDFWRDRSRPLGRDPNRGSGPLLHLLSAGRILRPPGPGLALAQRAEPHRRWAGRKSGPPSSVATRDVMPPPGSLKDRPSGWPGALGGSCAHSARVNGPAAVRYALFGSLCRDSPSCCHIVTQADGASGRLRQEGVRALTQAVSRSTAVVERTSAIPIALRGPRGWRDGPARRSVRWAAHAEPEHGHVHAHCRPADRWRRFPRYVPR